MPNRTFTATGSVDSPLGLITLGATAAGLALCEFATEGTDVQHRSGSDPVADAHVQTATTQLREYFAGERTEFDLSLDAGGTDFQRSCWDELRRIPCGETRSYGQLATRIGNPNACRAVGMANHRNPIAIIIPCHRVIESKGGLRGYAGGLERKQWLLEHEGAWAPIARLIPQTVLA